MSVSRIYMYIEFLMILTGTSGQKYYLSDVTSNTTGARDLCTLAAPQILDDGSTIQLTPDNVGKTTFVNNFRLWVGYVEILADFLYVGCSETVSDGNFTLEEADIGRCYSMCKTEFVGLSEKKCFCVASLPQSYKSDKCEKTCDRPEDTLCGKHERRAFTAFSIYKKADLKEINNGDPEGVCLSWKLPDHVYKWESCNKRNNYLCQSGSYDKSNPDFTSGTNKNKWKNAMKNCLDEELYPVTYVEDPIEMNNDIYWTGYIRSYVVSESTDTANGDRQGYIEYTNGVFELHFGETSKQMKGICMRDTASRTTQTIKAIDGENNDTTTKNADNTAVGTTQSKINPSTSGGNNSLVAVYVVVPIVVILVLCVIVAFCIRRKRNQLKRRENKSLAPGITDGGSRSNMDGVTNAAYTGTGRTSNHSVSEQQDNYNIIEPVSEYAVIKDNELGVYDSTNNSIVQFNASENVYNKLEDKTYDHADTLKSKEKQCENIYHHADVNVKITPGEEEDTYHHTNTLGIKNIKSDNKYERGVVVNRIDNEDDTYNHAISPGIKQYTKNKIDSIKNSGYQEDTYSHATALQ